MWGKKTPWRFEHCSSRRTKPRVEGGGIQGGESGYAERQIKTKEWTGNKTLYLFYIVTKVRFSPEQHSQNT